MKTLILASLIAAGFTAPAFAEENKDLALAELVKGQIQEKHLNDRIEALVQLELSEVFGKFTLNRFSVQWGSLRCLATDGFAGDKMQGVCTVEAGAFQVMAELALVVQSSGEIKISSLMTEVE